MELSFQLQDLFTLWGASKRAHKENSLTSVLNNINKDFIVLKIWVCLKVKLGDWVKRVGNSISSE